MSREETYFWKIKTADSLSAGTDARIKLSLHGDSGDMEFSGLVSEYAYLDQDLPPDRRGPGAWLPMQPLRERPKDFARNVVTLGRFPRGPGIGNLETGVLISDGSGAGSDWQVDSVRISVSGQSAVWRADNVGLVKGGVEKRLIFVLESETEWSPMAFRRKQAAMRELARTDPVRWLAQTRENDRMLASVRPNPYAEAQSRQALLEANWTPQQVDDLLAGRSPASQAMLGKVAEGSRVPTVEGTRVRVEEGVRVPTPEAPPLSPLEKEPD
jgi:hypothetical protein